MKFPERIPFILNMNILIDSIHVIFVTFGLYFDVVSFLEPDKKLKNNTKKCQHCRSFQFQIPAIYYAVYTHILMNR